MDKHKIFGYCFEVPGFGGDHIVVAIAEDGEVLIYEFSTTPEYSKKVVIEYDGNKYSLKYPNGFEVKWVDDIMKDDELIETMKKNAISTIYSKAPLPE